MRVMVETVVMRVMVKMMRSENETDGEMDI